MQDVILNMCNYYQKRWFSNKMVTKQWYTGSNETVQDFVVYGQVQKNTL